MGGERSSTCAEATGATGATGVRGPAAVGVIRLDVGRSVGKEREARSVSRRRTERVVVDDVREVQAEFETTLGPLAAFPPLDPSKNPPPSTS